MTRIRSLAAVITLAATTTLLAGPLTPDKPNAQLPPALRPAVTIPIHITPTPVPDPRGPMTAARMKGLVVSAPYRAAMLREVGESGDVTAADAITQTSPANRLGRLRPTTMTDRFGTTSNLTNDHTTDTEPTVISLLKGSVVHTVAVSTRFADGVHAHLYSWHSTSLQSFDGPYELTIPQGWNYSQVGDPYLSANGYTTGLYPGRIYCVSAMFNDRTGNTPSAIVLWISDDNGVTWTPSVVASASGGGHLLDKPSVTVSNHPGTRGYVYVSWVDININNNTGSSVSVSRSTNGGATFSRTLLSFDYVQFPQVVVNPNNGTVSAVWTNLTNSQILMASSSDYGVTFGAHEVVAGGNLLADNTLLNGGMVANSIPAVRYDWPANRIVVVYTGTGLGTDIYYTFKPGCTNCNAYGWQQPIQIVNDSTNDQFMPAIDFKLNGDVVVSYYDRRDDQYNVYYREYVTHMTPSGTRLYESQAANAPVSYPVGRSIGDYQDIWVDTYLDGEAASIPWIGFPTTSVNDLYFTRFFFQ